MEEEEEKKVVPTYELNRKNNRPRAQGYSIQELWNNQIGPNFIERYKNRELGKDKADQILRGLEETWTDLDDVHKRNLITLGNTIGDYYKDARTVEGVETLNPYATTTAAAIRTGEFALNTIGKVTDFVIGNPARGVGWLLGLDPRWREGLAVGAQLYFGPKGLKQLSKIKPKHLGIKQSISKIAPLDDAIPYTKKLINITDDSQLLNIIDDTFKYDIETFSKARQIYKHHPDAGWEKALVRAQQLKGITNKGLIKEFTSGSLKKGGLFDPKRDDTTKLMWTSSMGDLGIGDTGFGYNVRKKKSVREYRSQLFNEAGFKRNENDNFVFDLASLKNFLKGEKRRLASQVAQTREGQTVINSFAKTKSQTLPEFVDTYGGYMLLTGSKPNLHHEFAAMVSADLYDGLELSETPGSDWMRLTELLNENNIFPGSPVTDPASLGGPQSNLTQLITKGRKGAPPEPHDILHHQFYKDMKLQDVDEGKASFWDSRRWKMKTIEGRLEVAQEYADIVNEGNRIIKESMSQINALFGKNTDPEIIVNLMSKLAESGQLKIAGTNYRLKSVESIVKIIKEEVMASMPLADEQEVLKTVAQYNLTFDQEIDAIDLLHDIADYNESMRVYGQRPPSITLKKHKENIKAYMELIQGKLPLDEVGYNQKAKALENYTYKRVKPIPIQKQLEILFPEPEPTQLKLFNK